MTFEAGVTSRMVIVNIIDDSEIEEDELFGVSLSGATGGAIIGDPSSATVIITENDVSSDLAKGRPATASSEENTNDIPAKAVDGNSSTRWSSQFGDPQWIMIDLLYTYTVRRVVLHWETASAKDYRIEISSDGVNWTTMTTRSNMPNGTRVDELTGLDGTGRYVRMYGTARTTSWGYSLWSFEVYQ